jgi:hypothetical protein
MVRTDGANFGAVAARTEEDTELFPASVVREISPGVVAAGHENSGRISLWDTATMKRKGIWPEANGKGIGAICVKGDVCWTADNAGTIVKRSLPGGKEVGWPSRSARPRMPLTHWGIFDAQLQHNKIKLNNYLKSFELCADEKHAMCTVDCDVVAVELQTLTVVAQNPCRDGAYCKVTRLRVAGKGGKGVPGRVMLLLLGVADGANDPGARPLCGLVGSGLRH